MAQSSNKKVYNKFHGNKNSQTIVTKDTPQIFTLKLLLYDLFIVIKMLLSMTKTGIQNCLMNVKDDDVDYDDMLDQLV